jgi:hypothetical protein
MRWLLAVRDGRLAVTRIARWWFAPAPAERLAALRIAIGAYAVIWMLGRLPELWAVARWPASQLAAVGVVRVLRAPLPPAMVVMIAVATIGLLVALTVGWRHRVTAPLAALGLLWSLSYRSSWGMVFHTENLVVLHVIALALAPAADVWAFGRGGRGDGRAERVDEDAATAAGYGWAIKLLAALTCATYLLAGIAKLRLAGVHWLDGDQLRDQIAIDNARKALLGDATAPLASWLVGHPEGLIVPSLATLAIELGAPLALIAQGTRLGSWVTRGWIAAAWAFHVGVIFAMNVWFPYPLCGVAFLPLIEAERVVGWPRRWWSRGIPAS